MLLSLMLVPQNVWALGGSGTSSDPFTIANENDLFDFADRVNNRSYGDKCFKLVANITLTKAWTPIGTSSNPYTGTFDGNNKTISGLNLTATAANAGFFGYVNGATIKNFSLAGSISSGYENTGSVVGSADGATKIYNVYSSVNITMTAAKSHIGGIAGQLLQENSKVSEIKGCAYSGTMNLGSCSDSNGGIVGYCEKNANIEIEYCFFSGSMSTSVNSPNALGGILGYADDDGDSQNFQSLKYCFVSGTLSPNRGTYVGAIAGQPKGKVANTGIIANNNYVSGVAANALGNSKTSATSTPITISVTAGSNGTVSKSYVNPTISAATQLQVVATPNAHYHFGSWSDSGAQTHSVGLTANVSLTASFAVDQHQITVKTNNSDYGTVTGGGTYDWNSKQTIKATAKTHYHFVEWNDGDTDATRTITVTGDKTYTATFAIDQHTITVNVANGQTDMGTVSGGGTFDYNSTKTITATPKEHYHFVKWNDGNTNASRTITVTENKTYTASFAIDQHTITLVENYEGRGTLSGGGTYDYGTQVTISATPNSDYHFRAWFGEGSENPKTITVTGDATYKAVFEVHVFGEWITDVPATCTNTGTKHRNCNLTGCNAREDGISSAKGHSYGEWITDVAATCTAEGTKHRVCTVEGCDGREDGTIPATGHSFGEWITDVEATCIAEGTKHRVCVHAGCDERENGTIEMVDHTCSDFDANGFGECSVCHAEQYEKPKRDGNIWQIRNAGQLYYYADIVNKYNFILDNIAELRNDIVVNDGTFDADGNFTPTGSSTTSTPRSWTPIGNNPDAYYSVYIEGNLHTISGLYFNDETISLVGFVGDGRRSSIQNLGVINCYFKGYNSVGGIAGGLDDSQITNCYVTGRISGNGSTGGLCGVIDGNSTLSKCWANCIITSTVHYAGGICGVNLSSISDCYSMGEVSGGEYAGGICGYNINRPTDGVYAFIRNCYSIATVSGNSAGGICGWNWDQDKSISNCYSTSTLDPIAQNDGTAFLCESNVSVERLASGEITYKLNGSVDGEGNWTAGPTDGTQTWYQLLGTDPAPGYKDIGNNKVFYGYDDCRLTSPRYTNLRTSDSPDKAHKYTLEHLIPAQDEDGLYKFTCIYGCGTIVPDKYILLYDQNLTETEMIELSVDAEGKYYSDFNIHISDGHSFHSPVEFYCRGHIFMRPNVPYIDNETPTPATTMLPFSIDIDKINAERNVMESLKFYSFANLEQNLETGKWVANMYRVYDRLEAYTPYMILIYPETYYNYQGDQYSPAIFPVTPDPETLKVTEESGDWSFVGTNERKKWTAEDFGNGQAYYGFAAGDAETPTGKFVKVGQGAWIPPLRAYIKKNVQAGGASNAKARAADNSIPKTISVRFNDGETTGIAELNTETGEMSEVQWYDLNGRKIDEPTKGGIYIKNNKKVLVK